jgi:hypothetical protein
MNGTNGTVTRLLQAPLPNDLLAQLVYVTKGADTMFVGCILYKIIYCRFAFLIDSPQKIP